MKNFIFLMFLFVALVLFSGCGAKKTTYFDDDGNPERIEETTGAFESENLNNYYGFMDRHQKEFNDNAAAQRDAILTLHSTQDYQTKTEALQGGIIAQLLISNIRYIPPNVKPPVTMTEFFDRSLPEWFRLFLDGYQTFYGSRGKRSDSPDIVMSDSTLFWNSPLGEGVEFYARDYFNQEGEGHQIDKSFRYDYQLKRGDESTDFSLF